MKQRPWETDLAYCISMILAVPGSIFLAFYTDSIAARAGANLKLARVMHIVYFGSWFLSAASAVMAVLLWRSWRKSRIKPDLAGARCPMCGALCTTPGRCLTCGETFSAVMPRAPNPDSPPESN